jgi:HlyD family secretion protein
VTAARYRVKSAEADVRGARAGLAALNVGSRGALVTVRAPSSGRVLRVLEPSERVLAAGTPILIIGDLGCLEVPQRPESAHCRALPLRISMVCLYSGG